MFHGFEKMVIVLNFFIYIFSVTFYFFIFCFQFILYFSFSTLVLGYDYRVSAGQ